MTEKRGTGSFHIGTRGEGMIYVSKRLAGDLPFSDKDQIKITIADDRVNVESF
ncbi:MAG: hypothetical protein M1496_04440 [Candidatus Thermoplasmatota archaeon]|nr:hypothetical protein [Candidatus Thermoplasmatota archaeon]